jgi:hypothetical protein
VRSRKGFPLVAAAVLALLVTSAVACSRPRPPTSTTTTTKTTTPTNPGTPQVTTKKIRYGPFTVPNVNSPGKSPFAAFMPMLGATLENGMIWNQPATNVTKPCEDCFITSIQAGLEYSDGANANINNGMWLHHMVAMASGTGKSDATCQSAAFSLPHFAVGGTGANTERFFASGNERTTLDILATGKYGYKVNSGDKFSLLVDLMNLNTTDKTVYLTLNYKYVAGSEPGFKPVKPLWLDAAQCGTSEVAAKTGAYTLATTPWTANFSGKLLAGAGHLHDGGVNAVMENNGRQFCDSVASYGTKPEFIDPEGGGMDHGGGGMEHGHGGAHISEMTMCPPGSTIAAGDKIVLKGNYDDSKYPQMVHDGKLHSVMAIAILYYTAG